MFDFNNILEDSDQEDRPIIYPPCRVCSHRLFCPVIHPELLPHLIVICPIYEKFKAEF